MTRHAFRSSTLIVLAALALPVVTAGAEREPSAADSARAWIHLSVLESGGEATQVEVHLPISLVATALELAPDDVVADGKLELGDSDLTPAELRRLWDELRAAGDGEFVTVKRPGETVRLSRRGESLHVDVVREGGAGEGTERPAAVHARLPLTVVDALLAGEGDRLDLAGALSRLSGFRGSVLEVDDGQSRVRLWIDENRAPRP